jgi:hypothetical protein
MVEVIDPRSLPDPNVFIPGLKPPVHDFSPSDDGDPSEVDAFIMMIRELRKSRSGVSHRARINVLLLDTNVVSILFNRNRQTCIDTVTGHQLVISFNDPI